jgi:hypothetical protein
MMRGILYYIHLNYPVLNSAEERKAEDGKTIPEGGKWIRKSGFG